MGIRTTVRNRQWRVARPPAVGELIGPEHFDWIEAPVDEPGDGEFLVRTICLAPGPAQRGYLDPSRADFLGTVQVGEVMRGRGVGQIIASRHPDYRVGEFFVGPLGWQDYSIQRPRGAEFVFSTKKLDDPPDPLSLELGMLGQAGVTAWFGLLEVAAMQPGDRVLVSAAAGGVGSMVGQIARIRGASQVVGICGSGQKARWLTGELGFDAAINYREQAVGPRLDELFPDGIDVFFDNVGGDILNEALLRLAEHARIAVCGFISTNYAADPGPGPINYRKLVSKRARMEGFVVFDYWERFPEAERQLRDWYTSGLLKNCEEISDGLETVPDCLRDLFTGANRGIRICRVAAEADPAVSALP